MSLTASERRVAFANGTLSGDKGSADALAAQVAAHLQRRDQTPGWTTRAVWYEDHATLMAVVGAQEAAYTDLALAHGLEHAKGRALVLVLHEDWARPTLQRCAWLDRPVDVHVYSDTGPPRPAPTPSRGSTRRQAGGPETSPALHLGSVGRSLRPLLDWATAHPDLEGGHRRDVRAWAHNGQRVLTVRRRRHQVTVTAGVDAKSQPATSWDVSGELETAQLNEIRAAVDHGIEHAKDKKFGSFEEHHLQVVLRQNPGTLSLESPLLREEPAWRPAGKGSGKPRGRGFVDLIGLDAIGDLVIVETKLNADDMLVLQGLDYWVWATAEANQDWLFSRLNADPTRAEVRLLYAVGGKGGGTPTFSKYARAQLEAITADVPWQIAQIRDWIVGRPRVELLPPRTLP